MYPVGTRVQHRVLVWGHAGTHGAGTCSTEAGFGAETGTDGAADGRLLVWGGREGAGEVLAAAVNPWGWGCSHGADAPWAEATEWVWEQRDRRNPRPLLVWLVSSRRPPARSRQVCLGLLRCSPRPAPPVLCPCLHAGDSRRVRAARAAAQAAGWCCRRQATRPCSPGSSSGSGVSPVRGLAPARARHPPREWCWGEDGDQPHRGTAPPHARSVARWSGTEQPPRRGWAQGWGCGHPATLWRCPAVPTAGFGGGGGSCLLSHPGCHHASLTPCGILGCTLPAAGCPPAPGRWSGRRPLACVTEWPHHCPSQGPAVSGTALWQLSGGCSCQPGAWAVLGSRAQVPSPGSSLSRDGVPMLSRASASQT